MPAQETVFPTTVKISGVRRPLRSLHGPAIRMNSSLKTLSTIEEYSCTLATTSWIAISSSSKDPLLKFSKLNYLNTNMKFIWLCNGTNFLTISLQISLLLFLVTVQTDSISTFCISVPLKTTEIIMKKLAGSIVTDRSFWTHDFNSNFL